MYFREKIYVFLTFNQEGDDEHLSFCCLLVGLFNISVFLSEISVTVKSLCSGHFQDQKNCPLLVGVRIWGVSVNRGTEWPAFLR